MMRLSSYFSLSKIQLDAIKEICNIGAGNAVTALSKLTDSRIAMGVPEISILPFGKVAEILGGEEAYVVGIYLRISGSAPGGILFVLPIDDAKHLLKILLKKENVHDSINDFESSALMEVGNILTGSFVNALGMLTSLSFLSSVPAFCADMAGALVGSVLYDLGKVGDHVLFIKTSFIVESNQIIGYLFFLPEAESLNIILNALGVND